MNSPGPFKQKLTQKPNFSKNKIFFITPSKNQVSAQGKNFLYFSLKIRALKVKMLIHLSEKTNFFQTNKNSYNYWKK